MSPPCSYECSLSQINELIKKKKELTLLLGIDVARSRPGHHDLFRDEAVI